MNYKKMFQETIVISLFIMSTNIVFSQVDNVQVYGFIHSLVDHRPPAISTPSDETTTFHWVYDIAEESGKTFGANARFGQLATHVDHLPPTPDIGYEIGPSPWDEGIPFSSSGINTILITAGNFIQHSPPQDPDPSDPSGRTVINLTETLFDWVDNEIPDMRYYIYGNWPEMDLQNAYPPTLPTQEEINVFHNITTGTVGAFDAWWLDYQDQMVATRPQLNPRLIPVGRIISEVLTTVVPNQIPFNELYEDSDPHGRANIYFLAGIITYMALFEENIPSSYVPSNIISSEIRNNLNTIRNYVWNELNNFNFSDGSSRVFYSNTLSIENFNIKSKFSLVPNPANTSFSITNPLEEDHHMMQIFDIHGRVYKTLYNINSTRKIDVSQLSTGVYFIYIKNKNNQTVFVDKLLIHPF